MAELSAGRKREFDKISAEYILTKSPDGSRISYFDTPIRGVVDEIKACDQTGGAKNQAMQEFFGSLRMTKSERKENDAWLPYPYELVQHIDKNEALLPGLANDQLPIGQMRKKWRNIFEKVSKDDKKLVIGALAPEGTYETLNYILNPQTLQAISPAFDRLIEFDDTAAIIEIPNYHGVRYKLETTATLNGTIAPAQWQAGEAEYASTPDFLRGTHMSLRRVTGGEVVAPGQPEPGLVRINNENIFGLEPVGASATVRGRHVFDTTFKNIAAFAMVDHELRAKIQQPNEQLVLPHVKSPRINAQLQFTTYANGGGVLHLSGESSSVQLTLSADGEVTVGLYGSTPRELRSTDADYSACIDAVDTLLQEYFTRMYEENTAIDAEKLHVLRQKLGRGGMAGWFAAKTLRKNFNS